MGAPNGREGLRSQSAERRLARLNSPGARVVLMIAPAGYGKTTACDALLAAHRHSATCDCKDLEDPRLFARDVVAALARENPTDAPFFSDSQRRLAGSSESADWSPILDSAWTKESPHSLFAFENAEALIGNAALSSLLTRLLNTAPASRRVVVCSRLPLPAQASRFLPPHWISTLTVRDFVMDDAEAAMLLEAEGVDRQDWDQIIKVAQKWPVVLMLLARLSREGRLQAALSDSKDVEFEGLFEYFLHEVLGPLDPQVKDILTLCAVVPDLSAQEIRAALKLPEVDFERLVRKAMLLRHDGHRYTIHPLLRDALLENDPDVPSMVLPIARFAEQNKNHLRAAILYRLAGDSNAAACSMAALSLEALQTPESTYELVQLPLRELCGHAKLVAVSEPYRSDVTQNLLGGIFKRLSEQDDPEAIAAVAEVYSDWSTSVTSALEILHDPIVEHASAVSPSARVLLAGWEQTITVFFGAAASAQDELRRAYDLALAARLSLHSARMADYLARVMHARGDRESMLRWRELAVAHGGRCGVRQHASQLLFAIFDAWSWNDESAVQNYYKELEDAESATHHPDYAWLLRALDPYTIDSALPLWSSSATFRAAVMAAARLDDEHSARLFGVAEQACAKVNAPAYPVLLAHAAREPASRAMLCRKILSLIDPAEMPEYHAAVVDYAAGRPSFLDAYVSKFRPAADADKPAAPEVTFQLLQEKLVISEQVIRLTALEAAFLAFLSRRRTGAMRQEIQAALWPEQDEVSARDALYSLVHRLRKRAGDAGILESTGNGYRLGGAAHVDLWDAEFVAQKVERDRSDQTIREAEAAYTAIKERIFPHLQQLEWFSPIEFRVHELARTLAQCLVLQARDGGDYAAAISYANDLIKEEPCDDWAHEVKISVYLNNDDRTQAVHAYRTYCSLLEHEIGAQPSPEVRKLALAAKL